MTATDIPMTARPEVRRLTYADLPQVIAIERRAFPTPWSLAMFVLELSKPGGVCLAARRDGALVGYLICSRYDTVCPSRSTPPRSRVSWLRARWPWGTGRYATEWSSSGRESSSRPTDPTPTE